MLRNRGYVFVTTFGEHVEVFDEENALPPEFTGVHIRKAKEQPAKMVRTAGGVRSLGYIPIQGK